MNTQPQYLNKTSSCKTTIRCTQMKLKKNKNNKLKVLDRDNEENEMYRK